MRLLLLGLGVCVLPIVSQTPEPQQNPTDNDDPRQAHDRYSRAFVQLLLGGQIDGYLLKEGNTNEEVLDGLVDLLRTSEDPLVHAEAARALSRHAGPAYGSALADALSAEREVQFHALWGLDRLGWTIEVVDSGYAYRVRAPGAQGWTLGSPRFVLEGAWRGEHPHRYTNGAVEVSLNGVRITESRELFVTATVENVRDTEFRIDLCNWRKSLVGGMTLCTGGKTTYGLWLRERSAYCLEGRCNAKRNDHFGSPPHEVRTLQPGESLLVSVSAKASDYKVETPVGLRLPPFISCLPRGHYLVELRSSVNDRQMYQVRNLVWIAVPGDCPPDR